MRSRWYHRPLLHTALHEEKKVTWLELFYDLIFVAAIIQLGDALSANVSVTGFLLFAGHFTPLWVAWSGYTFFANRFDVDDVTHRLMVFIKMFALGAMAITAPDSMASASGRALFAAACAVAFSMVALLQLRAYRQVDDARDYSRYWGLTFAVGAIVWAMSVPFSSSAVGYVLWTIGCAVILVAPLNRHSRALTDQYPLDMEHLAERYGLLTIIVLGESFVKVLTYLAGMDHSNDFSYLSKGFFALFLTCCIWWVYFDDVAGAHLKKGRASWIVWLYGHLPLTLAITSVGVAAKKAVKFTMAEPAYESYRWLLAGSLALTFLAVAVIDSVTHRKNQELSDRNRINVRFGSAVLLLILAGAGDLMTAFTFLGLLAAIALAQVVFDIMMAPFEEGDEEGVSMAELAKERMAAGKVAFSDPGEKRKDVTESVRKGAPAELRRDLYFYFIEGSWLRVVAAFSFLYLVLNVFFAGLYSLQPGSIGEDHKTFVDAFAFSVQTLSTIGYGSISPATDYADVIVTIQSGIGIIFVAVCTGMMFAKASRPRASVLFSEPFIIQKRHGQDALVFRVGNARGNEVVDAQMSVTVLVEEITPEGDHMRKLYDLKLMRARSPIFVLSWLLVHEIDDESPLKDVDWSRPEAHIVSIICTMLGHDGTYGQTTYARHMYLPHDARPNHRFEDVISELPDGRLMIDYTKFHKTHPLDADADASAESSDERLEEEAEEQVLEHDNT